MLQKCCNINIQNSYKVFFFIVTKTNKKFAVNLRFKLTEEKGSFDDARTKCIALGGDLVTENLGPGGIHYHA